jgi:nitrous oxide reductase accessory protein NosL
MDVTTRRRLAAVKRAVAGIVAAVAAIAGCGRLQGFGGTAPPLVTFRQLITAITQGLTHSPGTLGTILFAEQPNVPYAPAAREQLATRRSAEQIKLLVGLLLVVALIAAPILLLAMR